MEKTQVAEKQENDLQRGDDFQAKEDEAKVAERLKQWCYL